MKKYENNSNIFYLGRNAFGDKLIGKFTQKLWKSL